MEKNLPFILWITANSAAASCFSVGSLPMDCAMVKLIDPCSRNPRTLGFSNRTRTQLRPFRTAAELLAVFLPTVGRIQNA